MIDWEPLPPGLLSNQKPQFDPYDKVWKRSVTILCDEGFEATIPEIVDGENHWAWILEVIIPKEAREFLEYDNQTKTFTIEEGPIKESGSYDIKIRLID